VTAVLSVCCVLRFRWWRSRLQWRIWQRLGWTGRRS